MSRYNNIQILSRKDYIYRTLIVLVCTVLIVYCMPRNNDRFNYQYDLNKPWRYSQLIASYDFPIYKDDQVMAKELDSVMRQFAPYYTINRDIQVQQEALMERELQGQVPDDYIRYIKRMLEQVYEVGVLENEDYNRLKEAGRDYIQLVDERNAYKYELNNFNTLRTAYEKMLNNDTIHFKKSILKQCKLNRYISANMLRDVQKSEETEKDLRASVSETVGMVVKGQKIVDQGELVDENIRQILNSLKREYTKRAEKMVDQEDGAVLGQCIFTLMMVLSFMLYLSLFRKDFLMNARNVLLLFSLMAIFPIISSFYLKAGYTDLYLIPYAMIPIFSRVFMDSRTAFMLHVCTMLICAHLTDSSYEFFVVEVMAGLAAIYALSELSQRSHIFRSSLAVTVTSVVVYCSIDLMIGNKIDVQNLQHVYSFVINGVLLLFAYPFMFLLEKMFGFTSNVTLVELSNTNNPLLRKMSEEAPGTFQHSMQVANLAAEAAVRVGAKSQLVRTGALYHDIGKIRKSIYFTENQNKMNPHEALTYEESARIIIEHVTEGIKLAEKYNLPKVIRDFIATHHGTGKAKYFYIKYKNEHQDEEIDDALFTYPGPNPFTPEQAILMMADSVEAASRSLQDYTTESINDLVERIIDGQVNDGYFRECPITFRDISTIKEVFKEKLRTIYHTRIQYPNEVKPTPRLEVLPTVDPHRSSTPTT